MVHTLVRERLVCAAYCLMPDHIHALLMGCDDTSDQHKALAFLRAELNHVLAPRELQKQAYDNVLREKDRERNAFQRAAFYVWENPVRKGLVERAEDYAFAGALVPGYPRLNVHAEGYWDLFWRLVG